MKFVKPKISEFRNCDETFRRNCDDISTYIATWTSRLFNNGLPDMTVTLPMTLLMTGTKS